MDFRSMLKSLGQLSEATEKTKTGLKHTAEPGGYGRKDDEDSEGNKVKQDSAPRGRGRPKKDADASGEVKKYDTKGVGDVFGGGKAPKKPVGTVSKKHSLKEYFDQLDQALLEGETIEKKGGRVHKGTYGTSHEAGDEGVAKVATQRGRGRPKKDSDDSGEVKKYDTKGMQDYIVGNKPKTLPGKASVKHKIKETEQIQIKPASQTNTQVIQQGNKTLGTVNNPQLANQIKQSIGKGEMSLNPNQQGMAEGKKAKPDFLDVDKDSNKKEPFKKAVKDKEKKKVSEGVRLQESPGTLEHIISKFKHEVKNFVNGGDMDSDLYEALFDYYADSGEIPYGIAKGRTGDPFEWVTQRFDQDVKDHVVDEGTFMPTKVNPVNIPAVQRKAMGAAPLSVRDVTRADPTTRSGSENLRMLNKGQKPDPFGLNIKEDPFAFESWDKQLNTLLTEGITVTSSTGQQGMPDSVSVNATDADAEQLLSVLRSAGVGVFGGGDQAASGYGAPMSGDEGGFGTEPEVSPDVVDDGDDMMALIKKMSGIGGSEAPAEQPVGTLDYADEEGEESGEEQSFGDEESGEESGEESEEQGEESGEEEEVTDEGNAFGQEVAQKKADNIPDSQQRIKTGGQNLPVKEEEYCETCESAACHCDDSEEEHVDESFANSTQDPAETEMYKLKALLSMGNDLNRAKRNQTTLPHTEVTTAMESLSDWKKLSGIR